MTILIALAAGAAFAQPAATPPAASNPHAGHAMPAPAAAPAATQRWSVQSTPIADLLANPAAKAIIDRHLPGLSAHPAVAQIGTMTLKAVQPMAGGQITDEHLAGIERDLAALPAN
jgi:para-nitrobenzyl esterase